MIIANFVLLFCEIGLPWVVVIGCGGETITDGDCKCASGEKNGNCLILTWLLSQEGNTKASTQQSLKIVKNIVQHFLFQSIVLDDLYLYLHPYLSIQSLKPHGYSRKAFQLLSFNS